MHTPRAASELIIGKGEHAIRRQAFFWVVRRRLSIIVPGRSLSGFDHSADDAEESIRAASKSAANRLVGISAPVPKGRHSICAAPLSAFVTVGDRDAISQLQHGRQRNRPPLAFGVDRMPIARGVLFAGGKTSNRFRTGPEVAQMDPSQFCSGTSQASLSGCLPTKSPRGHSIFGQAVKPANLWLRLHQQRLFPDLGPRHKCRLPRHVRSTRSSNRATQHSAPALWVLRILRLPLFCAG